MGEMVTIEGSQVTPSDRLGRGMRAKVELTDDIRTLIGNGSVILVDQPMPPSSKEDPLPDRFWSPGDDPILPEVPEPQSGPDAAPLDPVQPETDEPKPPPRNGATSDWQEWVSANVPGADTRGKSRDELIAIWEQSQKPDGE